MKKKLLLLLAITVSIIAASFTADAQRSIDLSVALAAPATGATITDVQAFNLSLTVTNNGPDSVRTTDTLVFFVTLDNSTTPISVKANGNPAQDLIASAGTALPPTVGGNVNLTLEFATAQPVGAHQFCISGIVLNRSADSVTDANVNNNKACNNITIAVQPNSIAGISNLEEVVGAIYPNPATGSASINVSLDKQALVSVDVLDVTGRRVLYEEKGTVVGRKTLTIDISALPAGNYIYQLVVDGQTVQRRLTIK